MFTVHILHRIRASLFFQHLPSGLSRWIRSNKTHHGYVTCLLYVTLSIFLFLRFFRDGDSKMEVDVCGSRWRASLIKARECFILQRLKYSCCFSLAKAWLEKRPRMPFATTLIPLKASSIKPSFRVQEIDKWIKPLLTQLLLPHCFCLPARDVRRKWVGSNLCSRSMKRGTWL